ncbi:PGPGW domain-containing protein [Aestuariibacter sp. A3R04]|uniref:PGPGW domain-containing protein n=1 Tax=Aestuariibacter sp. A3R04 TaxID=2841571 RepID=UPI001C082A9C|nr:PGPGW domain-containing protein [Aestuariibacter sp. A3R04]MBU3023095.1 tellurium resistance protein TerC [Aestuariibacter sp. A3R04]
MLKAVRMTVGALLAVAGVVFTIIPGSTLLILAGLVVLSYDVPRARVWLKLVQTSMSRGAKKLDTFLLSRKLR